jgi:hypothetical protein
MKRSTIKATLAELRYKNALIMVAGKEKYAYYNLSTEIHFNLSRTINYIGN